MKLTNYTQPLLRPEVPKDHLSRYVLPHPVTGKPTHFTRATTVAKTLGDTSQLNAWSQRNVVSGILADPTVLATIDLNSDTANAQLNEAVEKATEASGANVRRERGSQLHYFIEAVTVGFATIEQVPLEYQREVYAALHTVSSAGITYGPENVERTVFVPEADIVGTIDVQAAKMPNGVVVNLDWKSGRSLYWDGIAIQLAMYAHAGAMLEWIDNEPTWTGVPTVDQRVAIVAHVPVDTGTCTLYQVDIERGWEAALTALDARKYLSDAKKKGKLAAVLDLAKWSPKADAAALDQMADDPFAPVPDDGFVPVTDALEAAPLDTSIPEPSTITEGDAALIMGPLDEARARFQTMRARADVALEAWKAEGHKRRKKVMVQADEQASLVDDGVPSVEVYDAACAALAEAYGLGVDPTGPAPETGDPMTPADLGQIDTSITTDEIAAMDAHDAETEDDPTRRAEGGERMCLACNDWRPVSEFNGTTHTVTHQGGMIHHDSTKPRGIVSTPEPASVNPFADPPADDVSEVGATIRDALDHCETRADMAIVYNNFSSEWSDELTEYGNTVLSTKGK